MSRYFFKPNAGKDYQKGLNGKKVLVLGASYYCPLEDDCEYYLDCAINNNSYKYNTSCPHTKDGKTISDWVDTELDAEGAKSYRTFYNFMQKYLGDDTMDFDSFWDKVLFTNYVQHVIGGTTKTTPKDIREEYMLAFEDVLDEYKPDIVIVWGCIVNKPLLNKCSSQSDSSFQNSYLTDNSDDAYFYWNYKGRKIRFVSLYHPSSPYWHKHTEYAKEYLDAAFNE